MEQESKEVLTDVCVVSKNLSFPSSTLNILKLKKNQLCFHSSGIVWMADVTVTKGMLGINREFVIGW